MEDYYKILGVPRGASPEEIKAAFRRLAKKYHPDSPEGDAAAFKKISEAYQVLSDPKRRSAYDQFGTASAAGFGGRRGTAGEYDFDFGSFGDLFGDFFNFGSTQTRRTAKGEDLYLQVEISLKEAVLGTTKELEVRRHEACGTCKGTGGEPKTAMKRCARCGGTGKLREVEEIFFASFSRVSVCAACHGAGAVPEKPCSQCGGKRRVAAKARLSVRIPRGVESGTLMELKGEGDFGSAAESPGNLIVKILVAPDPTFSVRNGRLCAAAKVGVFTAMLGGVVAVPTIEGKHINLAIPSGTQHGEEFRMKGEGAYSGLHRGDLFVTIHIVVPRNLSAREREELRKMQKELGEANP